MKIHYEKNIFEKLTKVKERSETEGRKISSISLSDEESDEFREMASNSYGVSIRHDDYQRPQDVKFLGMTIKISGTKQYRDCYKAPTDARLQDDT